MKSLEPMKRFLRRGMKVTWSVNLSTLGGVLVLSSNVTCLSVFIRNYQMGFRYPLLFAFKSQIKSVKSIIQL